MPVYYYVGEDGSVTFDIEQMNEYFQGELQKIVFSNYNKEYIFK